MVTTPKETKLGVWPWIKDNSDALKILFAVVAGLYALTEYKTKDYEDRVKNSAEIVEKLYASPAYEAFTKVQDLLSSTEVSEKRYKLRQGSITSKEYHEFVSGVAKSHQQDFLLAIRGLKASAICVMQGRCEPSTVCMHLSQPIQEFRCAYRSYIAELSADAATCVIDEVNYFLDHYCAEWLSVYLGVTNYKDIKDNICLYDKDKNVSQIGPQCIDSIIYKKWLNPLRKIIE